MSRKIFYLFLVVLVAGLLYASYNHKTPVRSTTSTQDYLKSLERHNPAPD